MAEQKNSTQKQGQEKQGQGQQKQGQPQQSSRQQSEGQPSKAQTHREEQGRLGEDEIRRRQQNPNEAVGQEFEREPEMGVGRPQKDGPKQVR
ncbi:MAG: hypothetical protein R3F65_03965 [bacterium]|nr:hypothetical protein [Myxococcales bacterium]MCB9551293.1 hypothetical protein [Myxococcales bacterium]